MNKPETYSDYCDIGSKDYVNPIEHSLLHCSGSSRARGKLWEWIGDIMPIEIATFLANLTGYEFLLVLLGKKLEILSVNMNIWTQLLLKIADFVSLCFRNTIFSI